jgi:hypothetical protein
MTTVLPTQSCPRSGRKIISREIARRTPRAANICFGQSVGIRGTKNFLGEFYFAVVDCGPLDAAGVGRTGDHPHRFGELVGCLSERMVLDFLSAFSGVPEGMS